MIHLFRHSHAGTRRDWDGPDEQRPLTQRGWQESAAVAEYLSPTGITAILTSPYVRCVQSVEALAAATGAAVTIATALAEGTPADRVDALVREVGAGTVLCSHGDVISALIGRAAAGGADLDGGLIWEKASVWHLERSRTGRVVRGRYVAPPVTAS